MPLGQSQLDRRPIAVHNVHNHKHCDPSLKACVYEKSVDFRAKVETRRLLLPNRQNKDFERVNYRRAEDEEREPLAEILAYVGHVPSKIMLA